MNVPEQIVALLPELEVEKRVDVLLTLMNYLYPKRKAVERVDVKVAANPYAEMSSEERRIRLSRLVAVLNETSDEEEEPIHLLQSQESDV